MQGDGEELSIEELASNLSTYKDQLHQVRKVLDDDPGNSEYADMEKELAEVIFIYLADLVFFPFSSFFFEFQIFIYFKALYLYFAHIQSLFGVVIMKSEDMCF